MRKRIASVFMTLLLVSSAFVGATGTASAGTTDFLSGGVTCSSDSLWSALTSPLKDTCSLGNEVPDDLNATDANETKTELYGSLLSSNASAQTAIDSKSNTLEMTETIAKMEAKNAYIRALDNGSTEASARKAAHDAVEDFYTVQQIQYLNQWDVQMTELQRAESHESSTTGVSDDFINGQVTHPDSHMTVENVNLTFENHSVTMANGTSKTVTSPVVVFDVYNSDQDMTHTNTFDPMSPASNSTVYGDATVDNIYVSEPYPDYSTGGYVYLDANPNPYYGQWAEIESQHQSVDGEVNIFINNTYSQWEAGEINSTDLIDPYLASREYSPDEDYQAWALATLQKTGQQMPENISQFGEMNVTEVSSNTTHNGILLSDGLPASNTFEVGTTYNTGNLTGPQYVLKNDTIVKLEGDFRIDDATDMNGNSQSDISYTTVDYQTTNLTEYKQQIEELNRAIAEINARQDRLRSGGAGGFLPDLGGNTGMLLLVGAGAAGALYLREEN